MVEQVMEQATTPSIEDRVGNLFGDRNPNVAKQVPAHQEPQTPDDEQAADAPNPEEVEQTEPLQSAEEFFEFENNGKKYSLPKELEKAVLNEKDYTQKSQSNSAERRQIEVLTEQFRIAGLRQAFEQEVSPELQQMRAYDSVLSQPVDWASMSTDEAFRKKIQLDQWKDEREAIDKQVQVKYQQWAQKNEEAVKALKAKAAEVVSKRIPNWSAETEKAIREHAKQDGYTDNELDSAHNDPRHTLTLWKAQQFDLLKSKATKTVVDAKAVKTGPTNQMPQHVKDKLSFRKEVTKHAPGSQEHKAAVAARIGKIFG